MANTMSPTTASADEPDHFQITSSLLTISPEIRLYIYEQLLHLSGPDTITTSTILSGFMRSCRTLRQEATLLYCRYLQNININLETRVDDTMSVGKFTIGLARISEMLIENIPKSTSAEESSRMRSQHVETVQEAEDVGKMAQELLDLRRLVRSVLQGLPAVLVEDAA